MTDISGVAPESSPAPVEGAVINEDSASFSHPLGSQIPPEAEAKPDAKPEPKSIDESIDRAMAKSAAAAKEVKPDAKAAPDKAKEPAKVEQPRENGKFVSTKEPAKDAQPDVKAEPAKTDAKPSFTASEAPARFSPDAKAAWATAPEPVRAETERAIRELTEGHTKYKAAAEAYEGYRELEDIAKQSGKKGADVFREYYNMEQHLQKDLVGGLDSICQKMGVSLKDVAAHVMGQTPDQNASKQDATIRELKAELDGLKSQVGNVTQTFQKHNETATQSEVEKFAGSEGHERFEELAEDIAFFLKTRCPGDLTEAYKLAERLNPAPAGASKPAASSAAEVVPLVQPDKGQKSITGAPSSGSSPAGKKRVTRSLDEALDKAFGSVG